MMRLIKAFVFGISGLFIMITLISLLITSNVRVSRAVSINNAGINDVFVETANLNNWKNWHPMFKAGIADIRFKDSRIGKNTSCDILYNNKTTHIVITAVDTNSVKFTLQSEGENDVRNEINFTQLTTAKEVTVEWKVLTKLHWYPWEKFYAIFIDKLTGPGYEEALNNLKIVVEKQPV